MGVSWELLGIYRPCGKAQETGMAASRMHPEYIPNVFFALQIIFFGGNVRTFSQKNRIFAI
ncbi:hypothetical protein CIK89_10965 [Prevotella sp. P4-119]|nr:hypothetical protein CIK89_10965 [Prevotella sp. P4-119]